MHALRAARDVVTFEHEHVPNALLDRSRPRASRCTRDAAALVHAQDKIVMRERLTGARHARARAGRAPPGRRPRGVLADAGGVAVV